MSMSIFCRPTTLIGWQIQPIFCNWQEWKRNKYSEVNVELRQRRVDEAAHGICEREARVLRCPQ